MEDLLRSWSAEVLRSLVWGSSGPSCLLSGQGRSGSSGQLLAPLLHMGRMDVDERDVKCCLRRAGAAGGIGQPLALLLKTFPQIGELRC